MSPADPGRIVWADIADAKGVIKARPAVIVSRDDISGLMDVVAVTSRLPTALPDDHVLLPWHAQGHPRTGLNRRCAAVCTWLAQVCDRDVQGFGGLDPTPILATILAKIAKASAPPDPPTTPPTPAPETP